MALKTWSMKPEMGMRIPGSGPIASSGERAPRLTQIACNAVLMPPFVVPKLDAVQ